MSKIKMCGLKRMVDIEYANEIKPDFIGFVFWDKSKRNVTKEQARELKDNLIPDIKAVGVFVDADREFVLDLLNEGIIDIAQLHGSEDDEYLKWLKERTDKELIRMIHLTDDTDYSMLNQVCADYLLFDSGKGSGKTFDWKYMEQVKKYCTKPYFLAGGINAFNVVEAIEKTTPFGIDLSSSLETDGVKDYQKMKEMKELVLSAN